MNRKIVVPIIIFGILLISCRNFIFPKHDAFSGTLEMDEHSVGARVSGRITTLNFEEGQSVKAGQLLATLERYEQAKRDNDRTKKLFQVGGASDQNLEQSDLILQDQQIVSPVNGVVKLQEVGPLSLPDLLQN